MNRVLPVHRSRVKPVKFEQARAMRKNPTEAESILWQHLRCRKCGGHKFRRQSVILGYIVDFYCAPLGLVIEVDGEIHDRQFAWDTIRDRALAAIGIETYRFWNDEVMHDPVNVFQRIYRLTKLRVEALSA